MGTIEKIIRKNWLVYYILRAIHEHFLSNIYFESECKIFKYLIKKKIFK